MQKTLLDNTTEPEEWADVCSTYYSGGQIKQKTDPEGGVSYYEYDVNGFVSREWQGATFASGSPVGNPQKRYYYDGLGHKVLEADYLGKVLMDIWISQERLRQSREYNDIDAISRSNFEPGFYDAEVLIDNTTNPNYMIDWWSSRTLYIGYYFGFSSNSGTTILPTGGEFDYFFLPRRPYRGKEAVGGYYVDGESIDYLVAPDDGRTLRETRSAYYYRDSSVYWDNDPIGSVYDSMGRLIHKYSFIDDLGKYQEEPTLTGQHRYIKHEVYQYDASGNKTSETAYRIQIKEDNGSDPALAERVLEKSNSYEYDILNRLTKEIVDSNETVGMKLTTKYGYDAVGNRIYVVAPDGNVILTDYDNANRKVCEYFAATPVYYPGTDKVNVAATTAAARKDVEYYKNDKVKDVNSYDFGGGLLARSEYSYDSRGRIKEVNEFITASDIAKTKYEYSDAGFDLTGGDPCGYKYQIKITDANDNNTWISMNPLGKPAKIVYPSGDYEEYIYYNRPLVFDNSYVYFSPDNTLAYDDPNIYFNGLLEYKAVWDANGDKKYINYKYDEYGKVKKITYPDGGYIEYPFYMLRTNGDYGVPKQIKDYRDANNRPGELGSTYTFDYWYLTGKLRFYTDYEGYTVNYDYSLAYDQSMHIDVNAPNGGGVIYEVNYVYDMAGRLKDVCEPLLGDNCLIAGFDYDKNGNRAWLDYFRDGTRNPSNTTSVGYTYNRDNMLTGFATSGGPVFGFNASQSGDIDGLGRLKGASETITNTSQTQISHDLTNEYDMRSQLLQAEMTNVGSLSWIRDTYSYDKAGNVQSHVCANSLPPVLTTSYAFVGDLMSSASTNSSTDNFGLRWDKNGDMNYVDNVTGSDKNFVYNWDNKLRSATRVPYSLAVKYDPMGNRVWKRSTIPTTYRKYIVDIAGGLPTILLEIDPCNSSLAKTYVYANGEILAQHNGDWTTDNRFFYLHDRLGSVREVFDQNTTVVRYYTYDPFGKTREGSQTNSIFPFMFTGQYYDFEISQYYLRARQYDPQLMRFTGRDPVRGKFEDPLTLHRYLYCSNNSINRIDPTGESSLDGIMAGYAVYTAALETMSYGLQTDNDKFFDLGMGMAQNMAWVIGFAMVSHLSIIDAPPINTIISGLPGMDVGSGFYINLSMTLGAKSMGLSLSGPERSELFEHVGLWADDFDRQFTLFAVILDFWP